MAIKNADGTVTIPGALFIGIMISDEELNRLKNGGVDNWDWYYDSIDETDNGTLDDYKEEIWDKYNKSPVGAIDFSGK